MYNPDLRMKEKKKRKEKKERRTERQNNVTW